MVFIQKMKQFNLVVCGGTFDHFHKGHRSLLKLALSLGNKVVIGVTSDQYLRSSKLEAGSLRTTESFEERKQAVSEFVGKEGVLDKTEIVEINDLFGQTLDKSLAIDAIVVSANTKKGAEIINERRKKLRLTKLNIFVASRVLAEDGRLIASSRIRNGEIDREGKVYIRKEWFDKNLKLTENLRKELQKPFGELLTSMESLSMSKNNLVITVGDITTKIFNEKSLGQNLSVVDFKVAREKKFADIKELGFVGKESVFNADNPAGFITSGLFKILSEIFKKNIEETVLQINGEEDLVVLPLVLFSPLSTIIYYGQPHKGLVRVVVSEVAKEKAYNLILRLKSS